MSPLFHLKFGGRSQETSIILVCENFIIGME